MTVPSSANTQVMLVMSVGQARRGAVTSMPRHHAIRCDSAAHGLPAAENWPVQTRTTTPATRGLFCTQEVGMEVSSMIAVIEAHKAKVAQKANEVRELKETVEALVDDITDAEDELNSAVRALEDAADALSRTQ